MSAFYVGQMVRIIRAYAYQDIVGREATIVGSLKGGWTPVLGNYLGYELDILVGLNNSLQVHVIAPPDCIEPITRLDNTATTWDEMPCDRNGKFKGIPA